MSRRRRKKPGFFRTMCWGLFSFSMFSAPAIVPAMILGERTGLLVISAIALPSLYLLSR